MQSADLDVQPVKVAEEEHGNVSAPHANTQAGAAKGERTCAIRFLRTSEKSGLAEEQTRPDYLEKLQL